MIIKFRGEQSINKLANNLKAILKDIQERGQLEGLPYKIKDVELGVVFGAGEDKQELVVEHDGIKEVFTVMAQLDSKGNIKASGDNGENTLMDEYERAVAVGKEYTVDKEIESVYPEIELEEKEVEHLGDLVVKKYYNAFKEHYVTRYYRNNILVGEQAYKSVL